MKPLTAKQLLEDLKAFEKFGHDLSKITINYRSNSDSDVEVVTYIGEDLYDSDTNNTLESLVLMSDASDYQQ
jgi:hypothetical protein